MTAPTSETGKELFARLSREADAAAAAPAPTSDEQVEAVAIPTSMKPWTGGDSPPADWDGGPVLLNSGYFGDGRIGGALIWASCGGIIAYTARDERVEAATGSLRRRRWSTIKRRDQPYPRENGRKAAAYFPLELYEQLMEVARANDRSFSSLIVELVQEAMTPAAATLPPTSDELAVARAAEPIISQIDHLDREYDLVSRPYGQLQPLMVPAVDCLRFRAAIATLGQPARGEQSSDQ